MHIKRLLYTGFGILVLGLVAWCSISEYSARTMSAGIVLARLAGVSEQSASDATIHQGLLRRLPLGTPNTEIITFLEHNGVERDQFSGGQFVRYQVQDGGRTILALLTSPPWIMTFFCGAGNVGIRFNLDADRKLEDIVIENYERCL